MQVGPQPLGRNKPYAQVMVPHTGKFRSEDGERYYRHSKGARISKASHFDFDYALGHKIKFICVAKGSPRPSITWFKDGMEVYQHGYMHVSARRHNAKVVSFFFVTNVQGDTSRWSNNSSVLV